jgi:hypothetical protein
MLNFVEGFSCINWDDHVVFVFASVNMLYYIYCFVYAALQEFLYNLIFSSSSYTYYEV